MSGILYLFLFYEIFHWEFCFSGNCVPMHVHGEEDLFTRLCPKHLDCLQNCVKMVPGVWWCKPLSQFALS